MTTINATRFWEVGYVVVPDVWQPAEIDAMREAVMRSRRLGIGLPSGGGHSIADFLMVPALKPLHRLRSEPALLHALEQIFGGPDFRFCGHNDIGIDRAVGWHKDKLNQEYAVYQRLPLCPCLWPFQPYRI
jgi:hypothetical protein